MRTTRKQVEGCFERLAACLGKEVATGYEPCSGKWFLDHSSPYGGYVVGVYSKGGGEGRPLGALRRSGSEFCAAVWFALDALEQARR